MFRGRAAGLIAAATMLIFEVRPARADCRIAMSAGELQEVTVQAGSKSWPVHVKGAALTVRLVPGAVGASIEVTAPLHFRGTVAADTLVLHPAQPIDLFGGRLRIGHTAIGHWSVAAGGVPMPTELLELTVAPTPLVPCESLQLADPEALRSVNMIESAAGKANRLIPGEVRLFEAPDAIDPIRITFPNQVRVIARRGPWARIQVEWDDGSRLLGWVQSHDLAGKTGQVRGKGAAMEHAGVFDCSDLPKLEPVVVNAGAEVFTAPGGEVWAHLSDPMPAFAFAARPGDTWTRLASLQVLPAEDCAPLRFAWVRAAAVSAGDPAAAAKPGPRR